MTPRTRWNDSQPFLPIHLIDGDPDTVWSSFECMVPDAREEWIRIDLPMEGEVSSVVLTCKKNFMGRDRGSGVWGRTAWNIGNSLPRELSIMLSRDAWHWECVFHSAASGMSCPIFMEAACTGNQIFFTVRDGVKSVTASHTCERVSPVGSAGILHYPEDREGKYADFTVLDGSGSVLFTEDFRSAEAMPDRWNIIWNFWVDGKKPPAALRVDGIGWHAADAPNREYFNKVRDFRKTCESLGFRGQYFVNEIYAGSAYPPGVQGSLFRQSDMAEAKYYVNTMVAYSALNIESGPCHVHFTGFPHPQSVCRTTVASQVVAPSQPKPSYYAIRNIATAMDAFYEADFPVVFSGEPDVMCLTLANKGRTEFMIAIYLDPKFTQMDPKFSKQAEEQKTDIKVIGIRAASVWGIDTFNGTQLELNFTTDGEDTIVENILVKDYRSLKIIQI